MGGFNFLDLFADVSGCWEVTIEFEWFIELLMKASPARRCYFPTGDPVVSTESSVGFVASRKVGWS